ncbi:MAG: DUF58 domain-containing protein [Thermoguttaceae bacterium]
MMLLPTRKLLILLALPAVALLVFPWPQAAAIAGGYDAALLLIVGIDVLRSPRPRQIVIERRLPEHLSLGAVNLVGWDVRNLAAARLRFELTEDVPEAIERQTQRLAGTLLPRASAELRYEVTPTRRGLHEFGDIFLRWHMQLGLVVRQRRFRVRDATKVYPNVASLARYELAAQRHRMSEIGLAPVRLRGRGSMFESLRDYVPGDDLADAAWKATARHGRIMIRNFETERSQNVLVVLDCGRLMVPPVDQLSRLDCAINATLLLTYVAMKQGDSIGLVAFSNRLESYVPLVKGRAAVARMNESLYRLEARPCESDYEQVCKFLALRHRKRSLIVMLTDVIDRDTSSTLLAYAARFARYHLPLCVTLRNLQVEQAATAEPRDPSDCFTKTVALKMLARRAEALGRMRQSGVDVLDADPRQLTPQLLHRYLMLKARKRF